MGAEDTPTLTLDELIDAMEKDEICKIRIRRIYATLIDSYLKGHRGLDKQATYNVLNQHLKSLDLSAVEVFNRLMYH